MQFPIKNNLIKLEAGELAEKRAKQVGLTRSTYYMIRAGRLVPKGDQIAKLCNFYGLPAERVFPGLFLGDDGRPVPGANLDPEDIPNKYEDQEILG